MHIFVRIRAGERHTTRDCVCALNDSQSKNGAKTPRALPSRGSPATSLPRGFILTFKPTRVPVRRCGTIQEFLAGNAMISACLAGTGAKVTRCACEMLCSRRKWP
jgi:hypothetical protein